MTAIVPAAIRLREAAESTGQIERYEAWQAERNAIIAERAEMERQWAIEDAVWERQRNRLAVATIIDGALLALTVLALIVGAKWLATLLLIACVPGVVVAVAAVATVIFWPAGIYPWSRRP